MDFIFIYLESVFLWLVSVARPGVSQLVTNYRGPGVKPRVTTSDIPYKDTREMLTTHTQLNKLGEKDFIFNTRCQI